MHRIQKSKNPWHIILLLLISFFIVISWNASKKEYPFWTALKNKSHQPFTSPSQIQTPRVKPANPEIVYQKLSPPYTICIIGDSFIADRFGTQLERALFGMQDITVHREGVYSTGLARPDYFDWQKHLEELLNQYHPNVVIVMFGANDGQDIKTKEGKTIHYDASAWDEWYASQTQAISQLLEENSITFFWIGMPIAKSQNYQQKMERLNSIYENTTQQYSNALFISTWNLLKNKEGVYASYLQNSAGEFRLARNSDGIHVTHFGASILVQEVLSKLQEKLILHPIITPPSH